MSSLYQKSFHFSYPAVRYSDNHPQYNQPTIACHTKRPDSRYASSRTFSDIQDFMEGRKMKELPSFHPNTFGSTAGLAPIYCATRE